MAGKPVQDLRDNELAIVHAALTRACAVAKPPKDAVVGEGVQPVDISVRIRGDLVKGEEEYRESNAFADSDLIAAFVAVVPEEKRRDFIERGVQAIRDLVKSKEGKKDLANIKKLVKAWVDDEAERCKLRKATLAAGKLSGEPEVVVGITPAKRKGAKAA